LRTHAGAPNALELGDVRGVDLGLRGIAIVVAIVADVIPIEA